MATTWKRSLIHTTNPTLLGDRVNLPSECLESLVAEKLDAHPMTFQLVSGSTTLFVSVREFTAQTDSIEIGPLLAEQLDTTGEPSVTVSVAKLPHGVHCRLSPLHSAYLSISDLRATLEAHLRRHYATLTKGQTLVVKEIDRQSRTEVEHRFLVSELFADGERSVPGCIILDQDVTVDIEPLDVGVAEEAVRRKFALQSGILTWEEEGSTMRAGVKGSVREADYLYFQIPTLPGTRTYECELGSTRGDADLFISTFIENPTLTDHTHFNVDSGPSKLSFTIDHIICPTLYIGVYDPSCSSDFDLRIRPVDTDHAVPSASQSTTATTASEGPPEPGTLRCHNCGTSVPEARMQLHLAYCERNNVRCPHCSKILSRSDMQDHWHCSFCDAVGVTSDRDKHVRMLHTPLDCECGKQVLLGDMAEHRGRVCPARLHVCRFCHLLVPAGPPSFTAKDLMLGGMSSHESDCGARTFPCAKCAASVQLKDVQTHARMHAHQKRLQPPPFKVCSNAVCSNPRSDQNPNQAGLCPACFGPFWNPRDDPGHAKYAQKLVQVYHKQMTEGCGVDVCRNQYCATPTQQPLNPTDAAVKAIDLLKFSSIQRPTDPAYWLCGIVDRTVQARRVSAERLMAGGFALAWCIKALREEEGDEDAAREWLIANAPGLE
ncbi:hypothetical protein HKX48_005842 [Thoreauomyces humboldtii]|nr:hypothetical protein HKX48_005842 [Thoreauomyces humboldtii]